MSGSQQFPEWELHAEGEEDGDVVLRRPSSESDFFSEFFGPLSSNVSPRISLADTTAVATARVVGAGEEEVESTGNKEGKLRASTSGAKLTEEVGVPQQKRKRKRTTEMHNMTERRRRDKIKGKLKALQQLIPNSHKLDRASLLDEAIAYMKSLQLQLQIMSGGGLCHSPCVSPGAMPCLHMHHFSPFSHIGMGYGMGMAGIACPVRPPLMSIPSPLPAASLVSMPGLSTIPTFCPLSQPVPFVPLPEFPAAVATPTPSSPALQTGPFSSSHREDTDSQEAAKTQVG